MPPSTRRTFDPRSPTAPAALGFRMPAEWEPQAAIWLSWPHRRATWPGQFRPIPAAYAAYVAAISHFEAVRINCPASLQPRAERLCATAGADMARVAFCDHATDDAWCRDHGPIFIKHRKTGEVAITDWEFNAWGGKYPRFKLDNQIPARIARRLHLRRFVNPMVLEGGSIDVNGSGLLLTTEQCLLNPNRNPGFTREQIEANLRAFLGVRQILWLGEGIVGDDTDGHVDDLTRFVSRDVVVTAVEKNRRDANHRALTDNLERLRGFRTATGKSLQIVELPMPEPVVFRGRRGRVPASYANFLIVNGGVLVPNFRQPRRDAAANAILRDCFPDREVVPVDSYQLILGLGTLHCLSQQQPA